VECIRWECVAGYRDWGVGGWSGLGRCFLFDFLDAGGGLGVAIRGSCYAIILSGGDTLFRPAKLLSCLPGRSLVLFFFSGLRPTPGISLSFIRKEKHRRWKRCITYRVGGLLSASPAWDKQRLVIISLYLTYGKTWNLFIRLIS